MSYLNYFRKEVINSSLYKVNPEKGIKLNQNESPWDIPTELKVQITEKIIKTDLNRYPLAEVIQLKKKIAKKNDVLADQVVISNGSNVLLQGFVNATSHKHRGKVLILDPSFGVYEHQAELFGNKVIKIPLTEKFAIPIEKVLQAIKKENPTLILIANPNAPTGNLFDRESLYRIVKAAKCITVIDEAYFPFSDETVIDWIQDFPHLFVLRTFSKAFAMAGVRLGYAIGDSEMVYQLEKALMPFSVSKLTCLVGDVILDHVDYVQDYVKKIVKERNRVFSELQKLPQIHPFPSDSNYILIRFEDSNHVFKQLLHEGVILRNVADDNLLQNCLRFSIGTPEENDRCLEVLKKIL